MLTSAQKKMLLAWARRAMAAPEREAGPADAETEDFAAAHPYQGVFVSLHIHGKLRGCVGSLKPVAHLPETIWHAAQAAAFQDPRFPPLQPEELPEAKIEISLLHMMQPLRAPEEIEIGKDGLMIRLGENHGLLLPQVAGKRHWNARTFLQNLCRKADLAEEEWQNPAAELFRFGAEVFSDEDA